MAQHDIGVMTLLASCQQSAADLGESAFARQLGPDIYPAVGPARAEEAGVKARPLGQFRALGHALKAAAAQQPYGAHRPRAPAEADGGQPVHPAFARIGFDDARLRIVVHVDARRQLVRPASGPVADLPRRPVPLVAAPPPPPPPPLPHPPPPA